MKYLFCIILLFATSAGFAQDKNVVTAAVKEILPRQQKNLVAAAEEMPRRALHDRHPRTSHPPKPD